MKKLKKEDLEDLYGYYTGHAEVLKNGEAGYYFDPETKAITIVTCDGNAGDYSRVFMTRDFLSELGYIRNVYGETPDDYEVARDEAETAAKRLLSGYFKRSKNND